MNTKGLLCFNGPILTDGNGNYYGVAITNEFLEKYTNVVDTLIIYTRIKKVDNRHTLNNFSLIKLDNIKIIESPDFTKPHHLISNRKIIDTRLNEIIKYVDYVFVRLSGSIAMKAKQIADKNNTPCLVEVVTCGWDAYWYHSLKGKVVAPFMFYKMKKEIFNSSHVNYITKRFLQDRYPTSGKKYECSNVLINDFDNNVLENRLNRIETINNRKKIIIGTIGTLKAKYKGQEYVIKAVKQLIEEGYNIEYHIIGSGDSSRLNKIARNFGVLDNIVFTGPLEHNKIINYLDLIDIYIQPSLAEAQGRALIEALSRGCPSLCSNVGGMTELLDKNYVFKKGNVNSLVLKFKNLLNDDLKQSAINNFNRSREYEKKILNLKRQNVFKDFVNSN